MFRKASSESDSRFAPSYEAVRRLRAGGFSAPIVAVTASAMSDYREECLRLDCDDFISKPVERDRFLAKLNRLLSRTSDQ